MTINLGIILAVFISQSACDLDHDHTIEIHAGNLNQFMTVEVPTSSLEKIQGLMFRECLGPDQGMLFIYEEPKRVSFWMANVKFPLDLLFLDECGTIISIHAMAAPEDTSIIKSLHPVSAVLEILGGTSKTLGVEPGDRVTGHSAITCEEGSK